MKNNIPLLDKDFIEKHYQEFEIAGEIVRESVKDIL